MPVISVGVFVCVFFCAIGKNSITPKILHTHTLALALAHGRMVAFIYFNCFRCEFGTSNTQARTLKTKRHTGNNAFNVIVEGNTANCLFYIYVVVAAVAVFNDIIEIAIEVSIYSLR